MRLVLPVAFLLLVSPALNAIENIAPAADGVYLTLKAMPDGRTFEFVLMLSDGRSVQHSQGVQEMQHHFRLGAPVAFMARAENGGQLFVRVTAVGGHVARTKAPAGVSATGEHVVGQVLDDDARLTAFE